MKKLYALIALILVAGTAYAYHSGQPQPPSADQAGGTYFCNHSTCPYQWDFQAYQYAMQRAINYVGGNLGVNKFIWVHLNGPGYSADVRFHVQKQVGGGYYLVGYNVTWFDDINACPITNHSN